MQTPSIPQPPTGLFRLDSCRICGSSAPTHDGSHEWNGNADEYFYCSVCGFPLLRPIAPQRPPPPKPVNTSSTIPDPANATRPAPPTHAPPKRPPPPKPQVKSPSETAQQTIDDILSAFRVANEDVTQLEADARQRVASKLATVDAERRAHELARHAAFAREEAEKKQAALKVDRLHRKQLSVELELHAARAAIKKASEVRLAEEHARTMELQAREIQRLKKVQEEEERRRREEEEHQAELKRQAELEELRSKTEAHQQALKAEQRRLEEVQRQQDAAMAQAKLQVKQAELEAELLRQHDLREAERAAKQKAEEEESARMALVARQEAEELEKRRQLALLHQRQLEAEAAAEQLRRQSEIEAQEKREVEEQRLRVECERLEKERKVLEEEERRTKEQMAKELEAAAAKARQEEVRRKKLEEEALSLAERNKQAQLEADLLATKQQQKELEKPSPTTVTTASPNTSSVTTSTTSSSSTTSLLSRFTSANQAAENSIEQKIRDRLDAAVRWVDKEVRKLIAEILKLSQQEQCTYSGTHGATIQRPCQLNEQGQPCITFGCIFESTQDTMEALSGTLLTAKKRGVVSYEGTLLLQRVHDDVIITLLKTEIPDTPLPDHSKRSQPPLKPGGFDSKQTVGGSVDLCHVCTKRVYLSERVSSASRVYHTTCFRCHQCHRLLSTTDFCHNSGKNYCHTCYQQQVNQHGTNF